MKQFIFFFIMAITASFQLRAQDSLINNTVVDSTQIDSVNVVETPIIPKLDTTGLNSFKIELFEEKDSDGKTKAFLKIISTKLEKFVGIFKIEEQEQFILFENGVAQFELNPGYNGALVKVQSEHKKQKATKLVHITKRQDGSTRFQPIPLFWSIFPPLVAIVLALIFRQVLLALFVGIFAGAWLANGMQFSLYGMMKSLFKVLDTYIVQSLTDTGHLAVIIFSLLVGGVVALISRNGGMGGVVQKLSPLAKGPKSTQFVAWLLGIAIFFDDYANTLIVGNTIRPISDKFRISREKLAYIVDSTAAPIAAIAFITTWIGAELGYIDDALPTLDGIGEVPSSYSVFLASLPYSYYSIFTILFILIIIFSGRDFGAMFKAEKRARTTGAVFAVAVEEEESADLEELEPKPGAPLRWINGLLPILVVIFGTLLGLIDTGMANSYNALVEKGFAVAHNGWGEVWSHMSSLESGNEAGFFRKLGILIGNSDSYASLLWASLSAVLVAIVMSITQGILKIGESMDTTVKGFKTMLPALLILILAWALAMTTKELATAEFLTSALGDSVSPYMVPVIIFVLAALISFSTGSSWSTMAILYPIAIPLTWTICQKAGLDETTTWALMHNVIATVLSASVLGDHCSPISDTTILSSLASNCKHIDHVNTQLPYALTVGLVSVTCGYVATAFAIPFIVNLALGLGVLFLVVFLIGKKVD